MSRKCKLSLFKVIFRINKEMVNSIKKTEDFNKILDNLRKKGENKQCFDCGEKVNKGLNVGNHICSS